MVIAAGAPGSQPVGAGAFTVPAATVENSPVRGRILFVIASPTSIGSAESLAHGLAALPEWRGTNAPSHLVRDLVLPSVRSHMATAETGAGLGALVDGVTLASTLRVLCDRVLTAAAGPLAHLVELVPGDIEVAELLAGLYPDARRVAVSDGASTPDPLVTTCVSVHQISDDPRATLASAAGIDEVEVNDGAVRALRRNQSPRGEHRVPRDLLATPAEAAGVPLAVLTAQPGSGSEWLLDLLAVHPQVLVAPPGGSGLFAALAPAWRAALDPASSLHELAGSAVLIDAVRRYADGLLLAYTTSATRPGAVVVDLVVDRGELATARGLRPDAAFVHLIRDGRTVAAADWLAAGGHLSAQGAGSAWAAGVTRTRTVLSRSQHHREMRVEDIVAAPLPAIDVLIDLFDLGSDLATLDAFAAAAAVAGPPTPAPVPDQVLQEITAGTQPVLADLDYR